MKIAFVILGTRGDVQPMIALATGLMKIGHEAIICAPPENEELARQNNCPFLPFGPCVKKLVKEKPENALEMSQRLRKVNGLELTVNLIEKEFNT